MYIHYPVPMFYSYSDPTRVETTYEVKTFLLDRFILRVQADF